MESKIIHSQSSLSTGPRRGLVRLRAAAVLVPMACALAACGGSESSADKSANIKEKQQTEMLKFARCMRDHGVDYPDPAPDGSIQISKPRTADSKDAEKQCAKFITPVDAPSPAERKKLSDGMLALTKCLRTNGADVSDPVTDASGDMSFSGSEIPPAALAACRSLYREAGLRPPQ